MLLQSSGLRSKPNKNCPFDGWFIASPTRNLGAGGDTSEMLSDFHRTTQRYVAEEGLFAFRTLFICRRSDVGFSNWELKNILEHTTESICKILYYSVSISASKTKSEGTCQ
jgi:hypothetical protein